MIRPQVLWNKKKNMIEVTPGWPPLPSVGDHWVKPATEGTREKRLERWVLKIVGWKVTYEDQDGNIKTTHADKFQKWTDDRRAQPQKLREYVILKPDKDQNEILKLRKKKRIPKRHPDAYVSRRIREWEKEALCGKG